MNTEQQPIFTPDLVSECDAAFMRLALAEARLALAKGEVPTGSVIVWNDPEAATAEAGRVIGRAHNRVESMNNPTAHGEMLAIAEAASAIGDWRLVHATLYVTKEPCAMCAGALVLARVARVVYGCADPARGGVSRFRLLDDPNTIHRCAVEGGVLADECRNLLQSFFKERRSAP